MSGSPLTITPCEDTDVAALQQFINEHWRADHILARDEQLLRWQHDPSRMSRGDWPGPTFLLARRADRIVGILGLIGCDANAYGTIVPAAWIAMWMSLPETRTSGVGLKLMQAAIDLDLNALFVLGINDTVRPIYRRLGFQLIDDMPRWTRVFDPDATAELLQACGQSPPRPPVPSLPHAAPATHANLRIDASKRPFGDAWDRFWRERLAPQWLCTDRSAAYLNRRYVDHPEFTYETRVAISNAGGEVLGLVVFRVERVLNRPENVLRIVEFLAVSHAADALAQSVIDAASEHRAAFADFYCSSPIAARPLEAAGFVRESHKPCDSVLPCRFQPLEGGAFRMHGAIRLADPPASDSMGQSPLDDLYITKSDGDMDRPN